MGIRAQRRPGWSRVETKRCALFLLQSKQAQAQSAMRCSEGKKDGDKRRSLESLLSGQGTQLCSGSSSMQYVRSNEVVEGNINKERHLIEQGRRRGHASNQRYIGMQWILAEGKGTFNSGSGQDLG